jgi:hypothetical protein
MEDACLDVLRGDIDSAIEAGDWEAVGAIAALIVVASDSQSNVLEDDLASAIEAGDWAAAAEYEADILFAEWEEVQISQTLSSLGSSTNSNTSITTINDNTTPDPDPDPDPDSDSNSDQQQLTTTNGNQPSVVRVPRLRLRLPSWLRSTSRVATAPVHIQIAAQAQHRQARHRAARIPSTVRCPFCMAQYSINDNTVIVQTLDNHGNDVNIDCPICTEEDQLAYHFHKCCHQGICLPCAGHQNIELPP